MSTWYCREQDCRGHLGKPIPALVSHMKLISSHSAWLVAYRNTVEGQR